MPKAYQYVFVSSFKIPNLAYSNTIHVHKIIHILNYDNLELGRSFNPA